MWSNVYLDWKESVNVSEPCIHWQIQGRGPGGPPPLVFRPNWGPRGRKSFFCDRPPPPPLSGGLDAPLVWTHDIITILVVPLLSLLLVAISFAFLRFASSPFPVTVFPSCLFFVHFTLNIIQYNLRTVEACVAEQSTPRTLVGGSSLAHRVVSLDKEVYSTLSLFTQVYKWMWATYGLGVTLRWASMPSRGE